MFPPILYRENNGKLRVPSEFAVYVYVTVVTAYYIVGNFKSHTAVFARLAGGVERLKDVFKLLWSYAGAVVPDFYYNVFVIVGNV